MASWPPPIVHPTDSVEAVLFILPPRPSSVAQEKANSASSGYVGIRKWLISSHLSGALPSLSFRRPGLHPFPHTPFLACASLPPLRSGQVLLDEAEHLFHNQGASVAALRGLFAFGPECRSRSLRNHRSPSPEYSACLLPAEIPRPDGTKITWRDYVLSKGWRLDGS